MDLNRIVQSKFFSGLICGLAICAVLLLAFGAGMAVGFKKADFSYKYGDNYWQNFAGEQSGALDRAQGKEFMDSHGAIGKIISIDAASGLIVMRDRDNLEKIITVTEKTQINYFRQAVQLADLRADQTLVVLGDPDDTGKIQAKLIRVMPDQPENGEQKIQSAESTSTNVR